MPNTSFAPRAYEAEYPASSRAPAPDDRFAAARTFDMDLSAASANTAVFGTKSRCEPGDDQQVHTFHWLVFAATSMAGNGTSGAGCDLWRWHRGEWRSVFVAGATFSPEEMYAQGWRYCAPSVQLFVNFVSATKEKATVPPKRKRTLSLAVSAPPHAARRDAMGSI
jgi:hypothetical protein